MMRLHAAFAAPALSLALLLGLGLGGCNNEPQECSENVPCGFGDVCVEGTCVGKSCATSADCPMEYTCGGDGECAQGCANNDDCYPGDACNTETSTCEQAACRSTTLDCAFGEFCNTVEGSCYPASGYYCKECFDDDDCGGNNNTCLGWGANGNFCGVTCEGESDCPSGYTCVDVGSGGQAEYKQCITYCWLYITDSPPPPGAEAAAGKLTPVPVTSPEDCVGGVIQ